MSDRWAVWSEKDGFITDPLDDYAEAEAALERLVGETLVDDDDPDEPYTAPETIPCVVAICQHMRIAAECERCKG